MEGSFEFRDVEHRRGPVRVKPIFELVQGLGFYNRHWQGIPVVYNPDPKEVASGPGDCSRFTQLPLVATSAGLGIERKE